MSVCLASFLLCVLANVNQGCRDRFAVCGMCVAVACAVACAVASAVASAVACVLHVLLCQ